MNMFCRGNHESPKVCVVIFGTQSYPKVRLQGNIYTIALDSSFFVPFVAFADELATWFTKALLSFQREACFEFRVAMNGKTIIQWLIRICVLMCKQTATKLVRHETHLDWSLLSSTISRVLDCHEALRNNDICPTFRGSPPGLLSLSRGQDPKVGAGCYFIILHDEGIQLVQGLDNYELSLPLLVVAY